MTSYVEGHSSAIQMLDWIHTDLLRIASSIEKGDLEIAKVNVRHATELHGALHSLLTQLLPIADEMSKRLPARAIALQQQYAEARRLADLLDAGADPRTIARQLRENIHGGEHPA